MSVAQPIPIASSSRVTQDSSSSSSSSSSAGDATYTAGGAFMGGSLGHQRLSLGISPGVLGMVDASYKPALGSSIENDHDALIRAMRGADANLLSEDMCRNYTCCGLRLTDLHALVDHFEEVHVVVVDPALAVQPAAFSAGGFELPDDMELDEPTPSPSSTPPTPFAAFSAFDTTSVLVRRNSLFDSPVAWAPYPRDLSLSRRTKAWATETRASDCASPEVLFSPSSTPSPAPSRPASPAAPDARRPHHHHHAAAAPALDASGAPIPSRPKPFRCPKPGCNKSYKQANGLKYHITHGQCNFAPKDPNSDDLKPYSCQVGCNKRFKNMSGLRYHYQHSDEHGKAGLALLQATTAASSTSGAPSSS